MSGPNNMNKPWLPDLLTSMYGIPFIEQAIAIWLAYMADENGVVDDIDWDALSEASHVSVEWLKRTLREPDTELLAKGIIERETRLIGSVYLKPLFRIAAAHKQPVPS